MSCLYFIFPARTNVFALARLSDEYQIDWLPDEIKKYLARVTTTDIDLVLGYLQLSKEMEAGYKTMRHLLFHGRAVFNSFPIVRSRPYFVSLDRQIQVNIANMFLDLLLQDNKRNVRPHLSYQAEVGLRCAFKSMGLRKINYFSSQFMKKKKYRESRRGKKMSPKVLVWERFFQLRRF